MKDHDENSWMPGIIKTIASENKGLSDVQNEIIRHKNFMKDNNLFLAKREKQTKNRIKEIVENKIREDLWSESGEKSLNSTLEKVILGNLSAYHIAEEIIENFIKQKKQK
jgi:LAO/AO transport system kinase